jgi:hypothetical protein
MKSVLTKNNILKGDLETLFLSDPILHSAAMNPLPQHSQSKRTHFAGRAFVNAFSSAFSSSFLLRLLFTSCVSFGRFQEAACDFPFRLNARVITKTLSIFPDRGRRRRRTTAKQLYVVHFNCRRKRDTQSLSLSLSLSVLLKVVPTWPRARSF